MYSTIPLIVLFLIAIILSFSKGSKKAAYFFLIVACLVLIVMTLGFIFWIFGIAEVSGMCGIIREVNTGNTDILTRLGASPSVKSFVDSCFLENS